MQFSVSFDNTQQVLMTVMKEYSYENTTNVSFTCVTNCDFMTTAQLAQIKMESQVYRVTLMPGAVSMIKDPLENCFSNQSVRIGTDEFGFYFTLSGIC